MEILKLLVELAGNLAWPTVVLVLAIKFSPAIQTIIKSITSHLSPSRNIRARIGSFELESNEIPIKREELKQIAVEPDPAKRLELFKEKFDLEKALGNLEEQDVEWLRKFSEDYYIPNAFLVLPYGGSSQDEIRAFDRLEKIGLVKAYQAPLGGGEWIGMVTDKGKQALQFLISKK